MRWISGIVTLAAFIVGAGVVIAVLAYRAARLPYRSFADEELFVTIPAGTSSAQIAETLEREGVIQDARLFLVALRLRGDAARLQAGEYRFADEASLLEVLDRLVRGDVFYVTVTVPEGLTSWETAALLSERGLGEQAAFEQAFKDPAPIALLDPAAETLEGYLFPETYRFGRHPSAQEVARAMVSRFIGVFDDRRRADAAALGLSIREVVILASVVEKETGRGDERPLIASVFLNRLGRRMPLQSDPTIIYELKRRGVYDGNLRRAHLRAATAYNTYMRPGLPPGPIASPGAAAIDAVLEPVETSYLYFVSKNDGSHHFSSSLREHNAAVRRYQIEYFRNHPRPQTP